MKIQKKKKIHKKTLPKQLKVRGKKVTTTTKKSKKKHKVVKPKKVIKKEYFKNNILLILLQIIIIFLKHLIKNILITIKVIISGLLNKHKCLLC